MYIHVYSTLIVSPSRTPFIIDFDVTMMSSTLSPHFLRFNIIAKAKQMQEQNTVKTIGTHHHYCGKICGRSQILMGNNRK